MKPMEKTEYVNLVKKSRKEKRLHPLVQERLTLLLSKISPNNCTVDEISLVAGGRNDLISFSFDNRKIVFELFFSVGQVPQDLRLLEQPNAEVKIAILLDDDVDKKVSTEYFRKKPDCFPFLWLRHVIDPYWESYCIGLLRELTDENSVITQTRELLASPKGEISAEILKKQIAKIKTILGVEKKPRAIDLSKITGTQLACLLILKRVKELGIPSEKMHSFIAWLPTVMPHAFELVILGFQAFIVTDFKGNHALWSDGDLADDLFLAADKKPEANVVICVNEPINTVFEIMGQEKKEVQFHMFHAYFELLDKSALEALTVKPSKCKEKSEKKEKL
jgi:hypothetical protein